MSRVVDRVISEHKALSSRLSLVRKVPTVHRRDSIKSTYSLLKHVNDSSSVMESELSSQSDSFEFCAGGEGCDNRQTLVSHSVCRKVGLIPLNVRKLRLKH